jgi:probable rRNA maturation factor
MAIRIVDRQKRTKIDRRLVRRLVERLLSDHGRKGADTTIVFADDEFIRGYNLEFLGRDRPTDVLAFDMADGGAEGNAGTSGEAPREPLPGELETILGDVMISTDRAAVQARRYRRTLEREIAKLVSHGVLHLLGYDHEEPDERAEMRKLENRYVREFLSERPRGGRARGTRR